MNDGATFATGIMGIVLAILLLIYAVIALLLPIIIYFIHSRVNKIYNTLNQLGPLLEKISKLSEAQFNTLNSIYYAVQNNLDPIQRNTASMKRLMTGEATPEEEAAKSDQ